MKENENKEKKSNNNKYENKSYTGGEAKDLFRVPDNQANSILKYCDDRTLSNLLTVNKSWNKKINELKWDKRKEYLKYFLWYIYGRGNAERLCKVVDDVVNKLDKYKDNIVEEDDDKDQKFDEDKKFLFWHMVLLDILNIKMADLKLNFDEEKSKSVEVAINNYLLSDKAVKRRNDFIDIKIKPDHPERLLWEYSWQVFPEFKNVKSCWSNINVNVDTAELLGRIFACFLKVSFYQIKRVEAADTDKNNQEIYKNHKKNIYYFNEYLQEQIFGKLEACLDDGNLKYKRGEFKITSNIAAYLFETEELETWFLRYSKDFFSFFCNPDYLLYGDDGESTVEFFGFAFYLNKIKSFETRYRESPDGFWQAFYINIVDINSYRGNRVIADITSFISQTELQNKMRPEINAFDGYWKLRNKDLFNHQSLDTTDLEKNYFNPIIIRFCGQNDLSKKKLTDKVVQSISKVIKAKDGEDHKDGNKISEKNKLGDKNKVGFWQHFIFVLFFIFTCLSLFLCFKISLYFLILFAIFTACDFYLGFKNYCRGCCCALNIKTPVPDTNKNDLVTINFDLDKTKQNLINGEIKDDEIDI
ncbi:MAG: hypothetical protein IJU86_00705 [Firmicutes bacterium]|nr:hypothetical protein [Bacillota bacterium]